MAKKLHRLKKIREKVTPQRLAIPGILLIFLLALGLIWDLTPLSEYATPEKIAAAVRDFAERPEAPFLMVGLIILSQLVFMPLIVMTLATAMVFPPLTGILISLAGATGSAAITYGIGHFMGEKGLRKMLGKTLVKIRDAIQGTGLIGLIALRFVPVAPYSVMNIALGVMSIPFVTFITACFLELIPGCAIRAFLGGAISKLWHNPDPKNLAIVAAGVAVWVGVVIFSHWAAKRWKKKQARKHAAASGLAPHHS